MLTLSLCQLLIVNICVIKSEVHFFILVFESGHELKKHIKLEHDYEKVTQYSLLKILKNI